MTTVHYRCMVDLNIAVCLFVDTRNHAKDVNRNVQMCSNVLRPNTGRYPDARITIISVRLEFENDRTRTKLDRHWRSTLKRTYRFSMLQEGGILSKLYFEKSRRKIALLLLLRFFFLSIETSMSIKNNFEKIEFRTSIRLYFYTIFRK